jgi:hypothetical protein
MGAASFSKWPLTNHIPEDLNVHQQYCEKLHTMNKLVYSANFSSLLFRCSFPVTGYNFFCFDTNNNF